MGETEAAELSILPESLASKLVQICTQMTPKLVLPAVADCMSNAVAVIVLPVEVGKGRNETLVPTPLQFPGRNT